MRLSVRRSLLVLLVSVVAVSTVGLTDAGAAGQGPKPTPYGYDIYFVRHGQAIPADGPLSPLGQQQAAAVAATLHDAPVNAVYTSALLRAIQTGAPVAADHGLTPVQDARINEMGVDTSLPPAQIGALIGELLPAWAAGERRDEGVGPAGETYNQMLARFMSWWTEFVRAHKTDKNGASVVVAHGLLMITMIPEICTNPTQPGDTPNTAIVRARLHPNGTVNCISWNGQPIPTAY